MRLQAAILLVKLPHLDRWNMERRAAAAVYDELLADTALELPVARDFGDAVYHLYIVKARSAEQTEQVMGALKDAGIGTALYYPLALARAGCVHRFGGLRQARAARGRIM